MARYTNEMRERAVRMVAEVRPEHQHETAALRHVAGLLGMNVETLRLWVHRAQVDAGQGRERHGEPAHHHERKNIVRIKEQPGACRMYDQGAARQRRQTIGATSEQCRR